MAVSDAFGGTLANWTDVYGDWSIVSGVLRETTGGEQAYVAIYWSANSWNADQSSQVDAASSIVYAAPAVRMSGSVLSYYAYFNNGDVQRVTNGSGASIGSGATWTTGDTIKISATGSTIEWFKNGVSQGSTTDSTHASGHAGIGGYDAVANLDYDNWVGTGEVAGGGGTTARLTFRRPARFVTRSF
jgi:hypothetical protein